MGCRARCHSRPRSGPCVAPDWRYPNGAQSSHEKQGPIHLRRRDFVHSHSRGRARRRSATRQPIGQWTRPNGRSRASDDSRPASSVAPNGGARARAELDTLDAAQQAIGFVHRSTSTACRLRTDIVFIVDGVHRRRIVGVQRHLFIDWIGSECVAASSRGRRDRCVHAARREYGATGNDDAKREQQWHELDIVWATAG